MATVDKYEYNLKIDQMKSLYSEENYDAAADIADTINWNKVKNVNALVRAGEIYEKVGRYEEAKEILLQAYDRSPIGRTIIYRLAEVAIKMKDFVSAGEYYREFVNIAPRDNTKYVLRYEIRKAEGAEYRELIKILEEYKTQEYTEEWAYELAYLYHKAGLIDKCIEECDELILWFGDGVFVERALELKMLYQPLSKAQEDKYRSFRLAREGITAIGEAEMQHSGEYVHDPVEIPQVSLNPERFNTVNLQEEIAKGMQQIIEATEKETVSDTMDSIKKIVEDIPYLQIPKEEGAADSAVHIETDEEIDGALRINFQELLKEDFDGQISMVMSEKAKLEQQITGQMTIADVLEEWEKTKHAAEVALQEAEQRKLESAKARALQEAGDIMDRLNDVIPKLDAGATPKDLLVEEYLQPNRTDLTLEGTVPGTAEDVSEIVSSVNGLLDREIERLTEENTAMEEQIERASDDMTELATPEAEEPEVRKIDENPVISEVQEVQELPVGKAAKEVRGNSPKIDHLTDSQKAIFTYFVPVKGMEEQLCNALSGAIAQLQPGSTAKSGNIIISGGRESGKTVLATSLIKVLQQETGRLTGKIGKIDADALNHKDIQGLMSKIAGGCLIIERAGDLSAAAEATLAEIMERDDSGMLVILEGTSKGIKKALSLNEKFAGMFTEKINVPIFTIDELVSFAKAYALEHGYEMDELAVLALYNRISGIQKLDQATTLAEVKEIVDRAIEREGRFGLKKYFSILTARRYTDNDCILLLEEHFE
ncbi:MAG: hypothetical protein PUB52_08270 [Lachnospiraceae bacterium]|nr:hypothetical protein [Lachnospiraceae bacterium]MDD6504192.1 hypothetical protein [Lachnospiraceae bacterium]